VRKGRFLTELVLRELPGGERFALEFPLVYEAVNGRLFTVPEGSETDFASVPRILWNLLPPFGQHSRAAVLHDWLYVHAPSGMTRAEADALFLEAMAVLGVNWLTRHAMYRGVRLGGWTAWNRYRAATAQERAA
jgi:hypothetical protein